MEDFSFTNTPPQEDEIALRRARRMEARRQREERRRRRNRRIFVSCAAAAVLLGGIALYNAVSSEEEPAIVPEAPVFNTDPLPVADVTELPPEKPEVTSQTRTLGDELSSQYAVVVNVTENTVVAQKDPFAVISPASMTKVLTLLVAAEHVENLDDTFTMTIDITDYAYVNDCSVVGLMVGETVSVRELLYGTILPSGADAALGLAMYVAGSHEAFVELMNEKLDELGIGETAHFTNCVGLYDQNHKCSIYDMAIIMNAAMENELCRNVLNARTYETLPTCDHPDGQILSNWFMRRIEDRFTDEFQVVGAKTGYVVQAGSCAVSAGRDGSGKLYLCATGDASSSWKAISDHTLLYQTYCE